MQCQEFKYANAIVRVHTPDLAEDEKERRMKEVRSSAEKIMKEVLKNEYNAMVTNNN